MKLGVSAYLTSDTPLATMLDAIRLLSSGWMIYPAFKQEETPHGGHLIAPRENGASPRLTPRQEQVLKCLATEIGRAHVWTPVTNAHLVCRLLLDKKNKSTTN